MAVTVTTPLCVTYAQETWTSLWSVGESIVLPYPLLTTRGNQMSPSTSRTRTSPSKSNGLALQELMEKVVILRKAVERERGQQSAIRSEALSSKLQQYSSLLASQGSLATALSYIQESGSTKVSCIYSRHKYK